MILTLIFIALVAAGGYYWWAMTRRPDELDFAEELNKWADSEIGEEELAGMVKELKEWTESEEGKKMMAEAKRLFDDVEKNR